MRILIRLFTVFVVFILGACSNLISTPAPTPSATLTSYTFTPFLVPSPISTPSGIATSVPFFNSEVWTKGFGVNFTNQINDIVSDRLGNVYIACECATIENSSGSYLAQALLKYTGGGKLVWERSLEPSEGTAAYDAV